MLGVAEGATEKDITRAYRKLAKQFHPDANPGSEDRFKEISAAYDVLGDADKRKEYDEVRRLGPIGGGFGGGRPGGFNFRVEDLSDLFGGIFNGSAGTAARRRRRPAVRPPARCGRRGGPAPFVRRGRRGRRYDGQRRDRRDLPHLCGLGVAPGNDAGRLSALWRLGRHQ